MLVGSFVVFIVIEIEFALLVSQIGGVSFLPFFIGIFVRVVNYLRVDFVFTYKHSN